MYYNPASPKNYIHIFGLAVGRIHNGTCSTNNITGLEPVDAYYVDINITSSITTTNNNDADVADLYVKGQNNEPVISGRVFRNDCTFPLTNACPHFNFTMTRLLPNVIPPAYMAIVNSLPPGHRPRFVISDKFPDSPSTLDDDVRTGIMQITVSGCNSPQNPLHRQACNKYFNSTAPAPLTTGIGVLSFDVQGLCNGCDSPPRPIPILCADNISQTPNILRRRADVEESTNAANPAEEAPGSSEHEDENESRISVSGIAFVAVAFASGIGIMMYAMARVAKTPKSADISKKIQVYGKAHQSDVEDKDKYLNGLSDASDTEPETI
jgi:hypothetical protein